MAEAGIKTITFSPEDEAKWLEVAQRTGWAAAITADPAAADLQPCLTSK